MIPFIDGQYNNLSYGLPETLGVAAARVPHYRGLTYPIVCSEF